jgi:hypothetical protein
VLREPTLPKWWGTAGAPSIPRSVDSRPPRQVACRHRKGQGRGARAGGSGRHRARERAQAGSVPRIARGLEGKKIGLVIAVARAPRLRAMTFPSPIVPSWHKKRKKRGRFGVGAGLRGQIPDRPPILEGSVGPSKAPLAYRPTSFRPSRQGHGSISDRVPTPRGVERVGVTRDHLSTERLDAPYPRGLGRVVALPQPTKRGAPVRTLRYAREW